MSSLISLVVVDQEPRVDSRLIASQLGVEHKNTRSLIEQYQTALENFGKVPFETEASGKTNQQQKFALLNEDQSYLLLTYSQNTDQARDLKKRLVRAFGEQRRAIPSLDAAHDLPVIESSLVLDFQGVPIRFLIALASNKRSGYDLDVPAKSGAGRDNPIGIGALALLKALFLCVAHLWWATLGNRKVGRFLFPVCHPNVVRHPPHDKGMADSMLLNRSLSHV